MILSDFRQRILLQVPNTNQAGIGDTYLNKLINQACDEVNILAKIYYGYTDFNIEANKYIYNLSTYVTDYLGTDKRGLFFLDSNSEWQDIIPKTSAWISERYPDFLNASAVAIPQWYWIEGDELGFHPKPSTSTTNGARLYHLKKATAMTEDTHYPWSGSTTEITAFRPLDDAIVAYARWKLSPAFGNVTDVDLREREFMNECRKGAMRIKSRRDLMNESSTRMKTC